MLFFFIYYLKATKYTVSQRNRFIPIIKIAYIMTITAPLPPLPAMFLERCNISLCIA